MFAYNCYLFIHLNGLYDQWEYNYGDHIHKSLHKYLATNVYYTHVQIHATRAQRNRFLRGDLDVPQMG